MIPASLTSTAMSYPVTSQPQCTNTCYQTQLSDWHTGLTDCCNDMPVCKCPGRMGRKGSSPHTFAIFTLPGIPSSNPLPSTVTPLPHQPLTYPTPSPITLSLRFLLYNCPLGALIPSVPPLVPSPGASTAGLGPDRSALSRSVRHFRSTVPRLPHL